MLWDTAVFDTTTTVIDTHCGTHPRKLTEIIDILHTLSAVGLVNIYSHVHSFLG